MKLVARTETPPLGIQFSAPGVGVPPLGIQFSAPRVGVISTNDTPLDGRTFQNENRENSADHFPQAHHWNSSFERGGFELLNENVTLVLLCGLVLDLVDAALLHEMLMKHTNRYSLGSC